MDRKAIEPLRQRLLERRRSILGRVARIDEQLGELDESSPAEIEEEAQELNEARIVTQLGQRSRAELETIEAAIERMMRGAYGVCEACEEPIAAGRLDALPTARTCTACAAANERIARQRAHPESEIAAEDEQ
jgi:DnaK suppressor protein